MAKRQVWKLYTTRTRDLQQSKPLGTSPFGNAWLTLSSAEGELLRGEMEPLEQNVINFVT